MKNRFMSLAIAAALLCVLAPTARVTAAAEEEEYLSGIMVSYTEQLPGDIAERQYLMWENGWLEVVKIFENRGSCVYSWDMSVIAMDAAGNYVYDDYCGIPCLAPGETWLQCYYLYDADRAITSVQLEPFWQEGIAEANVVPVRSLLQVEPSVHRRNICLQIEAVPDTAVDASAYLLCFDAQDRLVYISADIESAVMYASPGETEWCQVSAPQDLDTYDHYEVVLNAYGYSSSTPIYRRGDLSGVIEAETYIAKRSGGYAAVTVLKNISGSSQAVYAVALGYDAGDVLTGVSNAYDSDIRNIEPGGETAMYFDFPGADNIDRVDVIMYYNTGENLFGAQELTVPSANPDISVSCSVSGNTAQVTLTSSADVDIWYPKVYVLFFDENHNFVDFAMDTNLGRQYCLAPGASVTLSLESGGPAASAEVYLRAWHGDRELYGE